MSIQKNELSKYLHDLLGVSGIKDYCPNGLQVEGKGEVKKIVSGVTASKALIERAIEVGADAILVHHGFFWKNESAAITGMKYQRIKLLIENQLNLFAYHLPLDVHPELGNNVQLANLLDAEVVGDLSPDPSVVGIQVRLPNPISGDELEQKLLGLLGVKPVHIDHSKLIQNLGICTGGAQGYLDVAADAGLDAYITGEISEPTVHIAQEREIHFFAAGHHATERYGVKALGEHLEEKFGLIHEFIDLPIPV